MRKIREFFLFGLAALFVFAAIGQANAAMIFVSNEKDNTVSVIDSASLKLVTTIDVGQRPRGIIITPDHKTIVVCLGDDGQIAMIDANTFKVTRKLDSGSDPGTPQYFARRQNSLRRERRRQSRHGHGFRHRQDDRRKFRSASSRKAWPSIRAATSSLRRPKSTSMAHFIDAKTFKVLANVLVDSRPRYAEFTADGSKVWVTSEVGGTVSVIDAKTFKILNVIHFDVQGVRPELISPVGITFTKDGKRAFISLGKANRLGVVDTSNYNVVGYVLVGQRPWHTALNPDGATHLFGQWREQRHHGRRCCLVAAVEIGAGRPPSVGIGDQAVRQTQNKTQGTENAWKEIEIPR